MLHANPPLFSALYSLHAVLEIERGAAPPTPTPLISFPCLKRGKIRTSFLCSSGAAMCVCMPFAIILDGDRIICFHMLSHHAFSLAFDPVARAVNCFFAKPQRGPGTISWTLTWVDYSFDKLIAKNPLLNDSQGRQTEVERQALKKSP